MSNSTPENQDVPAQNVPWYKKKPVMITGGVLAFLFVVGLVNGPNNTSSTPEPSDTSNSSTDETAEPEVTEEPAPEPEPEVTEEPEPEGPVETIGQSNAVDKANSYLEFSAFSRSGLIDQLEFEGFSTGDATYAVDAIIVDWNEQAAKKAESYLEFSSFSKSGLYDQLIFEGFTSSQANYGVKAVGY
jgi:hypothetical protein